MTELTIVFLVNIVASALKRYVLPKYGDVGVQVSVFVLAVIGALYVSFKDYAPTLQIVVVNAIAIFSLAVAFYEVLLKHLTVFKKGILE